MRATEALAAVVVGIVVGLGVACVDFGLDGRHFRCDSSAICGPDMTCGADGYCVAAADGGADAAPPDGDGTGEVCDNRIDDDDDDLADCADLECPVMTLCGTGCVCDGRSGPQEVACGDMADNDADSAVDCRDDDCPACSGALLCCPDGACRTAC